jgi:5-methylcytosine-specific restriction endonuclease McrA
MRNVQREPKPHCLSKHARRWRDQFLDALQLGDIKLIRRRRTRYNHPEVRRALDKMYRNQCCYCESEVGPVRADQIEHRMPVERFPERAFEWENLHLACGGCNGAKSSRWDTAQPILDAVIDIPIDAHLTYECSDSGVRCVWLTDRGHTTEDHAELNREKLRGARDKTMLKVVGVIQGIKQRLADDPNDALAANRLQGLKEMYTGPYGSMIRWAVTTLLR